MAKLTGSFKWLGASLLLTAVPLFYLLPQGWVLFELANAGMTVTGVIAEPATAGKTVSYEYIVGGVTFVGGGKRGFVHKVAEGPVKGSAVAVTYLPSQPNVSCLGSANEQLRDIAAFVALVFIVAVSLSIWICRHGRAARLLPSKGGTV